MYATRGLVTALLDFAREADPEPVSAALDVTPAREFTGDVALPPETPVFTHFYLPNTSRSVNAVFGVDLGTPVGQTKGRFLSHPRGEKEVLLSDNLHATILVAIPPWDEGSVIAYSRSGVRQPFEVLDAEPPRESLA